MKKQILTLSTLIVTAGFAHIAMSASDGEQHVADEIIESQRAELAAETDGAGYGPQAPRDIDVPHGENARAFGGAPGFANMNLCNIHFHESAEHRGGEFTTYIGNGNGEGHGTGFVYDGELTEAELAPIDAAIGQTDHGGLVPGDTIEIHFVHSSAKVSPGPTLGACVSPAINNPHLRVEAVVAVLVNDRSATDFVEMATVEEVNGFYQAPNVPKDVLGEPVEYAGSTTGPGYNKKGSPFHVTWSVHPKVVKVDIDTVGAWLGDNVFKEDHAHGVRNLVKNPFLLSKIKN